MDVISPFDRPPHAAPATSRTGRRRMGGSLAQWAVRAAKWILKQVQDDEAKAAGGVRWIG